MDLLNIITWPRGVLNRSVGDRTDVMTLPSLFSPLEKQVQKNELQWLCSCCSHIFLGR